MAKIKRSDVLYGQRRKVLNYARDLARSGEHADHQTILPTWRPWKTSRLSEECSRIAPSVCSSTGFAPWLGSAKGGYLN